MLGSLRAPPFLKRNAVMALYADDSRCNAPAEWPLEVEQAWRDYMRLLGEGETHVNAKVRAGAPLSGEHYMLFHKVVGC